MKNYCNWYWILLITLFLSFNSMGYDTCTDKNIEFCLEDGRPPVFDYAPPKKKPKLVKKKAPEKDFKVVLDTSTGFSKGEISKDVETLGYGDSAIYEKLSKEGFNPEQDYFVEDKSGKEVLILGGEKIQVRRLSKPKPSQSRLSPTGVVVAPPVIPKGTTAIISGVPSKNIVNPKNPVNPAITANSANTVDSANQVNQAHQANTANVVNPTNSANQVAANETVTSVETKRVFTVDKDGIVVAKNIQVATNPVNIPAKSTSAQAPQIKKNIWGDFKNKYQSFKTSVWMPRYEKAKAKIKNILSRFLKRE